MKGCCVFCYRAPALVARVGAITTALVLAFPACAQFTKQIDADGRVTYRDDPSYDYSRDEPGAEDLRRHAERLRRLRESLEEHRTRRAGSAPKRSSMTVRSGRSVCLRRINPLKLTSPGCN